MAKDLLYRPNLGYDKNYYTEGREDNSTGDNNTDTGGTESKEDHIASILKEIDDKINFLSDDLKNVYLPPYYGMKDEYDRVVDEYNKPEEEPDPKPDPIPDDKDKDDNIIVDDDDKIDGEYPPLFDRDDDIYIEVDNPFADPVKILKDNYYVNFIDVYEDYLKKLNVSMTNYIMTTLQTIAKNEIEGQLVDYSSKSMKNKDLLHLSDYLTKSEIIIKQTMRLHKKLFQIDEIILHVRSIRISKEQMIRYNSIVEKEQIDSLDVDSNIILKESIRVSEKKYEENLYSLYKYLNSSVILLDESLKSITKQNKAMIIINNNEERD